MNGVRRVQSEFRVSVAVIACLWQVALASKRVHGTYKALETASRGIQQEACFQLEPS